MSKTVAAEVEFEISPFNNERLASLCGQFDQHLRQIEQRLGIEIFNRGASFRVVGDGPSSQAGKRVIEKLYQSTADKPLSPAEVNLFLQESSVIDAGDTDPVLIRTKRGTIKPRGGNQARYVEAIRAHDINFGIGPAGTGKTYLAVACAVEALIAERVQRLVLVRPAVEAGERLGFLPGDLVQKVDPYLRPLYDALYEMFGFDRVSRLMDRNVIEVAPLAFMRGRTLNDAFVILDEGQNTSVEQMKMFLTRIGFGSTAVVTGDITQIDLPSKQKSGLRHVVDVLKDIDGITFNFFTARDVVRHRLVQRVVEAYDSWERHQSGDG